MTTQNPLQPSRNGAAHGAPKFPPPPPPTSPVAHMYTGANPMYTRATPMYVGANPMYTGEKQPPNHMALSIAALVCSLLFGAIGLYFSSQVTTRWNAGDVAGARKASNLALVIDIIGIVIGVFFLLVTFSSPGY
ncbi:CD225/dispanin family protein [Geodermatophilus sp. YIM 151500]|uniref:CD225/dispanin family protein n=1 Tax=Geodermatophilus sp. YIM 151500 TaxID=2984531 RepID=UPI0021E4E844|nr:CD225/dispanin family protein [Geodermatophilus sp. YIM 151500]MCV2489836.1 CD225/dispanin family protein [Geodermatophilus sp. YIM 151500]